MRDRLQRRGLNRTGTQASGRLNNSTIDLQNIAIDFDEDVRIPPTPDVALHTLGLQRKVSLAFGGRPGVTQDELAVELRVHGSACTVVSYSMYAFTVKCKRVATPLEQGRLRWDCRAQQASALVAAVAVWCSSRPGCLAGSAPRSGGTRLPSDPWFSGSVLESH